DGRAPARERNLLATVVEQQRERRVAAPRLCMPLALLVEGRVVPDVAPIDDDRELHVIAVVLGARRELHPDEEAFEILRRVALHECERLFWRGDPELLDDVLRALLGEVRYRALLARGGGVLGGSGIAISCPIFDRAG